MKKLIIAGNAPSLKAIDYQRLPEEFEVFRCNQFYFEDKYYLGDTIKAVFHNPMLFFEQYYTLKQGLTKEYQFDLIFCSNFNLYHMESKEFVKNFHSYFPDARLGYGLFKKLKEFNAFCKFNEIYFEKRITSGVYMCAIAIALGYKELYLAGIDFYTNGGGYAFNNNVRNLTTLAPGFLKFIKYEGHTQETDLKALQFLEKNYGVKFYCLCPSSPLADFIELAPLTNSCFKLKDKSRDYTKDILIPSKEAYAKFSIHTEKIPKLKTNFYFKAIQDLFRLPSDIKHYIKDKK